MLFHHKIGDNEYSKKNNRNNWIKLDQLAPQYFLCLMLQGCFTARTTDAQWSLFSSKSQTFGLGQTHFGSFGVFSANLSAPILVLWVPCPGFSLINHYFYKKLSLYIQIPNMYLGLGFEFGPQRIRDLAIVCP